MASEVLIAYSTTDKSSGMGACGLRNRSTMCLQLQYICS
ncbi:hypothetical protein AZE42_11787 [Rhizopogon vesiculosus]|uniref:Uncharacterized protein n=1 Tax=Rhizopogon vesiculosus TaxID=180088 RepID=A0A1J8QA70_9AGAM|nr:hypothetical protein AZE42_11787 [Rhizopogon vesiculosus]